MEVLTKKISRLLKPYFRLGIYTIHNNRRLHTFFKNKTDNNRLELIYKIPCKEYERCYIGQTLQHLGERMKQHKKNCNKADKPKSSSENDETKQKDKLDSTI